jgi:hypothetical protein
MSAFYEPEYKYTSTELDQLALSGEPIDRLGYTFRCRPGAEALTSAHYGIRTINTRGMGNHGDVILVGKTPYGRRLVRMGKLARLKREGCDPAIADVAISMPYGMEPNVWRLATELLRIASYGVDITHFEGHRDFTSRTGIEQHGCSFPRIQAAAAIALAALAAQS